MDLLIYALIAWNAVVFIIYGIDKGMSKKKGRRIPEKTLLSCAFLMGGVGALLGMALFRHKTKHMNFRLLVPLAILINAAVVYGIYFLYFK